MKLFHFLLASLLFLAIFTSKSEAQDVTTCKDGYQYGGTMKVMAISDCCDLWIEYCWQNMHEDISDIAFPKPNIFIKHWYLVPNGDCNLDGLREKFLENYSTFMDSVAAKVMESNADLKKMLEDMDIQPCDGNPSKREIVVTSASCVTDPYNFHIQAGDIDIPAKDAQKITACAENSSYCEWEYILCYEKDAEGVLHLAADYRNHSIWYVGKCPEKAKVYQIPIPDPNYAIEVDCNVVCD